MAAKKATASKKTANKKPVKKKTTVSDQFGAKFPQFLPFIDNGPNEAEARKVFGNELIDLLKDVAANPDKYDTSTQAGLDAIQARISATPYYQQTAEVKKQFDALTPGERQSQISTYRIKIASEFGDYYLTQNELNALAYESARAKLDGVALSQYVATRVGTRKRGKEDVLATTEALQIKNLAKAYNYNPSDLNDQIFSAVTGQTYGMTGTVMTAEAIAERARRMAKATYFNLADQIDAGLTLDEIFTPYKEAAARLLELPESNISFADPLYGTALSSVDGRQMTIGEWTRLVKSDPRYGYQFTNQANKDATNIGLTIARAFGAIE